MSVTSLQAMEVRTLQQTLTNQTQNTRKRKLESSGDRFYTVELPDEIWLLIFSKLNFQDLCRLMRVCTKFNGIAQDASLWKSLLYKHWEVSLKKTDLTPPLFVFRNFMQGTCAVNTMPLPLGTSCIQPISEKRVLCKSPKETISLYNLESKTSEDDPINLSEPITCIQMQDEKVLYGTQTHVVIFSLGPDEKTSDVVIKDFGIENLSKINGISISCLQILGNTLFVGNRHEILLLDLMERKHLGTLKHTSAQDQRHFKVTFMQASSTQLFVGSENGIFESWDYPEQKRLLRLKAHDKPVDCWQLLGSRLFLGSGQENIIKLWDLEAKKCLRVFKGIAGGICLHVLGSKIFYDQYNGIGILDIRTGKSAIVYPPRLEYTATVRKIWILGAKVFAATDHCVNCFDFEGTKKLAAQP